MKKYIILLLLFWVSCFVYAENNIESENNVIVWNWNSYLTWEWNSINSKNSDNSANIETDKNNSTNNIKSKWNVIVWNSNSMVEWNWNKINKDSSSNSAQVLWMPAPAMYFIVIILSFVWWYILYIKFIWKTKSWKSKK